MNGANLNIGVELTIEKRPEMIQTIKAMLTDPVYFKTPEKCQRDGLKQNYNRDYLQTTHRLDSQKCLNLFY